MVRGRASGAGRARHPSGSRAVVRAWSESEPEPAAEPDGPPPLTHRPEIPPTVRTENPDMTKHSRALTPSDIADRCRALGATVIDGKGADGSRLQVRSPVRGSETVLMTGTAWRSHADQSDTISHLKRVGLDVLGDPMFEIPAKSDRRPTPADVARCTNGHAPAAEPPSPGPGRPTLVFTGPGEFVTAQDDSGPIETRRDTESDGQLDVWEYISDLEDRIVALTVRLEAVETDVRGARDENDAERAVREMTQTVRTAFATLPAGVAVPRSTIADMIGIGLGDDADPGDVLGHRLSHVLKTMRDGGEVRQHGVRSGTRWSRVEQNGETDDRQ